MSTGAQIKLITATIKFLGSCESLLMEIVTVEVFNFIWE